MFRGENFYSSSDLRAEGEGLAAFGFSHISRQPQTRLMRAGQDSLVVPAILRGVKTLFFNAKIRVGNLWVIL